VIVSSGHSVGQTARTEAVIRAADSSGGLNSMLMEYTYGMVPLRYPAGVRGVGTARYWPPLNGVTAVG
jgi:hypothetical protein